MPTETPALDISFTEEEVETLLKAVRKYRMAVPSYLESRWPELELLDVILEKLTAV